MLQFQGFKPEALQRIAGTLGYQGDMQNFQQFLAANPDKQAFMDAYTQQAQNMVKGGAVRKNYNEGGMTIGQESVDRLYQPVLPQGGAVEAVGTQITQEQMLSPDTGQVSGTVAAAPAVASVTTADMPEQLEAATVDPRTVFNQAVQAIEGTSMSYEQAMTRQSQRDIKSPEEQQLIDLALSMGPGKTATIGGAQPAQADFDPRAEVDAQQQQTTSVANVEAAQGTGILMQNPVQRQIESGELISGVANAQTAAAFNEQIQAAQATPSKQATVQGQLEGLMDQFEGGQTPAWAAGAMRAATAAMTARGLGASSMAGQAIIQAAMESALPIAQADAATMASFEAQNLSNRQQRAMLAAEQRAQFMGMEFDQAFQARVANASRIADVANMNFTAEQQVALENSRIANSVNLQNLNNKQAVVMAEAAALSQLDMANLSNRQQAAVQNAQNFMQMDMANLSNEQQAAMFKAQAIQQALFTDQAAENAAKQFNATSENQTNQFFSNLKNQTAQFNAAQMTAQAQFNAGEANVISRFNAELINQRDQFNAQNKLVIDQANVQWRREVATADTAAVNRANEINAATLVDMSNTAYNNLWQYYSDTMEFAYLSAENERDRTNAIALQMLANDAAADIQNLRNDYASSSAMGSLVTTLLTSDLSKGIFGGFFG